MIWEDQGEEEVVVVEDTEDGEVEGSVAGGELRISSWSLYLILRMPWVGHRRPGFGVGSRYQNRLL